MREPNAPDDKERQKLDRQHERNLTSKIGAVLFWNHLRRSSWTVARRSIAVECFDGNPTRESRLQCIMAVWTWLIPGIAIAVLAGALVAGVGPWFAVLCAAALMAAVIVAVHHAEVVAHRVGEPFGTLVLALAVTVIEASLILSLMIAGGEDAAVIPRDTIYAAVMIICNGVVGICILVGGLAHHEQTFRVEGSSAGLAALIAMSSLALVLPDFTITTGVGT